MQRAATRSSSAAEVLLEHSTFENVLCVRETEILVEQQTLEGVFICDHAGLVINKIFQHCTCCKSVCASMRPAHTGREVRSGSCSDATSVGPGAEIYSRGVSKTRNRTTLGDYGRPNPRALGCS